MSSNSVDQVRDVNPARARVEDIEDSLAKLPQVYCPVRHLFAYGRYIREMTIPAGTLATGAVHKTRHPTIIVKGHVTLISEHGEREYRAGAILTSQPGSKKAAYAHEDTVLMTIHRTFTTDLDALVEELTESKPQELLGGSENKQLLANKGQI